MVSPPVARSQDDDDQQDTEIDWKARFTQIVDVKTEHLDQYLKNSKSGFDRLILARINTQPPEANNPSKYEVIWYRKGEPIGLRRLGDFPFKAPQQVALRVAHGTPPVDENEVKAAANACLRLFLDLNAKTMSPAAIFVPRSSFNPFVQQMNQLNFYSAQEPPPDTPVYTSIVLSVESEPPGLNQLLFYSGNGL
jgi:hypothetical protein